MTYLAPAEDARGWHVMWSVCLSMYCALKLMSWHYRPLGIRAPVWRHAAYLLAWPGMNAGEFLGRSATPPSMREWTFAATKFALGMMLMLLAFQLADTDSTWIASLLAIAGIAFSFHFGLFHLLSCFWRRCGVCALPIMQWPVAPRSLSEFWGRRWNRAFRDLTQQFLFRPLAHKLSPTKALLTGFFVSGLIHELAISLPAGAGWGGPTAYFLIQAAGILVERETRGTALDLTRGVAGWCFCATLVVLPVPLLFHGAFLQNVIVPFLRAP